MAHLHGEIFEVQGSESDPSFSGPIEVRWNERSLEIRWLGEAEWLELPWWALMVILREPIPQVKDLLAELRVEAREKGYNEGLEAVRDTASSGT
jgi:hypothetical protein